MRKKKYKPIPKSKPRKQKKVVNVKGGLPLKIQKQKPQSAPKELPETPISRKGLTLRKLIKNTPPLYKLNSRTVKVTKVKKTKTKAGKNAVYAVCYTKDPNNPNRVRRNHDCVILGMDPDNPNINRQRKVVVSCDCESYTYVFEYANTYYGASRIIYSNGEKPIVTNPSLTFGLCKHLYALASLMIKKDL